MPNGAAGSGFNDITYTFNDSFLDVTTDDNDPSDGSTFTVEKDDDYNWSGWVNTPITFEFPMVSGGTVPYEGYELLAVTVNVIMNIIGEEYDINFPTLKAKLLDDTGVLVAESTSSITDGTGSYVFDDLVAGTYRFTIGSDINGDNAWGGPGEMMGASELFTITDTNVTVDLDLAPQATGVANNPPEITSNPASTKAYVGQMWFYGVQASDEDDDSLTYSYKAFDSSGEELESFFLGFGGFGGATTISGTPSADDIGVYTIRIIVSDGTDAAVQEFELDVEQL